MIIFDYIVKEFADAVLMKASLPVTQADSLRLCPASKLFSLLELELLLLMPIFNEVPTILQKNATFQATNYEDIARGRAVPDEALL